jgi:hypothetical protein
MRKLINRGGNMKLIKTTPESVLYKSKWRRPDWKKRSFIFWHQNMWYLQVAKDLAFPATVDIVNDIFSKDDWEEYKVLYCHKIKVQAEDEFRKMTILTDKKWREFPIEILPIYTDQEIEV